MSKGYRMSSVLTKNEAEIMRLVRRRGSASISDITGQLGRNSAMTIGVLVAKRYLEPDPEHPMIYVPGAIRKQVKVPA